MAVTMKDIAELTGVSIGTVDRALNNRGRIKPEVAQRIRKVAEELNYKTNSLAKSLSTRKKQLKIAVVLHIQHSNYFDEVEKGIRMAEEEISDFGIEVVIYRSLGFDADDQLRQIELALREGASALILVPIDSDIIARRVLRLQADHFPVVFLSSFLEDAPCFASVRCDYVRSGWLGAGLMRMLSDGTGDVLIFSNSFAMLGHRQRVSGFTERLAACCPRMQLRRVIELPTGELDTYQAVSAALRESPCQYVLYSGNAQAGLKAIEEWDQPITSVFYDLSQISRQALMDGKISAIIYQSPMEQGQKAVTLLFEYLISGKLPEKNESLIPCQILLQESLLPIG